jgi:hypothetical protein
MKLDHTKTETACDGLNRVPFPPKAKHGVAFPVRCPRTLRPRANQLAHDIRGICRRNPEWAHRAQADRLRTLLLLQADRLRTLLLLQASWCKGGRKREIPIRNDEQRQLLDVAKALAKGGSLIPVDKTYKSICGNSARNATAQKSTRFTVTVIGMPRSATGN